MSSKKNIRTRRRQRHAAPRHTLAKVCNTYIYITLFALAAGSSRA